ncbi:MAG: hypothetical protein OEY94_07645 [Alphaproteobacteria bacterium]|nr:hypothetical protein [Alphaproteobacteria bacterium]
MKSDGEISFREMAEKVGNVIASDDKYGIVVFESNGIIKVAVDRGEYLKSQGSLESQEDYARIMDKMIEKALDASSADDVLLNYDPDHLEEYIESLKNKIPPAIYSSDDWENKINSLITALKDPSSDKDRLLEEFSRDHMKFNAWYEMRGVAATFLGGSMASGGNTISSIEFMGIERDNRKMPQILQKSLLDQTLSHLMATGILDQEKTTKLRDGTIASESTETKNASTTYTFLHEHGHYARGMGLGEAGADFYAGVRALQLYPNDKTMRDVIQFTADARLFSCFVGVYRDKVGGSEISHGFGPAFALYSALKIPKEEISKMGEEDIVEQGAKLDGLALPEGDGRNKENYPEYDALYKVKEEVLKLSRESGMEPDISTFRKAVENVLSKEKDYFTNGTQIDDAQAKRVSTLMMAAGAFERLEQKLGDLSQQPQHPSALETSETLSTYTQPTAQGPGLN